MPELPEVETTRRGIIKHIKNQPVTAIKVRQPKLRWPVTPGLLRDLPGQKVKDVQRRGKYLLLMTDIGTVLMHLGMSGSLRIVKAGTAASKHDHVDITFAGHTMLRFTDPRRFGCILWHQGALNQHPLLRDLGPEPLTDGFNSDYLYKISRQRKIAIKAFIMDSHVVVGVGNIYANEALFLAGIRPGIGAGNISRPRYRKLNECIKQVLKQAIGEGGTSLRDFTNSDGKPGYFKQSLLVYGRGGEACTVCSSTLKEIRLAGRSTVYCSQCQS